MIKLVFLKFIYCIGMNTMKKITSKKIRSTVATSLPLKLIQFLNTISLYNVLPSKSICFFLHIAVFSICTTSI